MSQKGYYVSITVIDRHIDGELTQQEEKKFNIRTRLNSIPVPAAATLSWPAPNPNPPHLMTQTLTHSQTHWRMIYPLTVE